MSNVTERFTAKPYDLNSLKGLFALLLIHTIGPQMVVVLPGLVQGYVERLGYSEKDAGFLASMETWGMFVATFVMIVLISRVNWRTLMAGSLLTMILANVGSMLIHDTVALYVLRFIAGFGGATIVVVSYAMIGLTIRKNRNFGWALFFVLLYGAVVFPILPKIYALFGINGAFFLFAAFAACGLPFVRGLPVAGKHVEERDPEAINLSMMLKGLAVVTMLLYFIGQIGVWSYFYRFGIRYGMSEQAVGSALSISQFFGLAGAFSVVLFSRFVRRDITLFLAIGISIVTVATLFGTYDFLAFVLISGVYQYLWNGTHPFLLGALASFDPSGRVIVYGTAMQFLGVAAGPAIAALIITEESLSNVLWMGILFMLASLVCILPPVIKEQKLKSQKITAGNQ